MFKIFLGTIVLLTQHSQSFAAEPRPQPWDQVCAAAEATVTEGDLIYLDIPNILFRRVASATRSWTSHVGIVFKSADGKWVVSESTVPFSRETSLCHFLKKSSKYKFEIRRLNHPLEVAKIAKMRDTANSLLGKTYDLGFNFDSTRMFCSKFVYLIYQSVGIEAGEVQSFQELMAENPHSALAFWKFWFLGKIPGHRRTVTPASQLIDPKFITVLKGE